MIAAGTKIPVELYGGPGDMLRTEVTMKPEPFDIYLFGQDIGGRRFTLAYQFANRSTNKGQHWVLEFVRVVGCSEIPAATSIGTSNTVEELP